jgi:hypothetical protein
MGRIRLAVYAQRSRRYGGAVSHAFEHGHAASARRQGTSQNMTLTPRYNPIMDPQELERLLVARENEGDIDGMVALFEPDAIVELNAGMNDGRLLRGHREIRAFFAKLQTTGIGPDGRRFVLGQQRPALISGDLALTSTRSIDGDITSEVARRQPDGSWLWVIDRYSVQW